MKMLQPNYAFSPSLLDAFQRMVDTKVEDFFYQDETGAWHLNWNESEETFHYSEEEVDALLKQEFLDKVNKVPQPPSEAASKGTCFNEIVDCIVLKRRPTYDGIVIKTIKDANCLYLARQEKNIADIARGEESKDVSEEECEKLFAKLGTKCIYASLDGFEFFFDINLCREAAEYFKGSIAQYYTKATFPTALGNVEVHGYIDYLRRMQVFDLKTTKRYDFGDYQKRWQRFAYPFTLIESGMMDEVTTFEFTIYVLKGGTSRTPIITGNAYKEVYTYDHEQARTMLTMQCERLIEFLEINRDKITNKKIFGYGLSD